MGGKRAATPAAPVRWRIGEVAKQTGVTTRTLRYWEELGLLQPASRTDGGERLYGAGDVRRVTRIEEGLEGADVIIALRVQSERIHEPPLSMEDYILRYQLTAERLRLARADAIVLHPGPIIRGLEIDPVVADGPQSCILEQVTNGLAVRMALLFQLVSGAAPDAPHPAKENLA